ncbi:hypothetical protein AM334_06060 [Klebsiella aerogenes]|nr:hypothetical protein AM334_06060 [Klebsiella aerogenes]
MPNRSPDEALADIRDPSPVALTLTGATDQMPNRSPDEALADIRDPSPVALTLTGATGRMPNHIRGNTLNSGRRFYWRTAR